MKRSELIERLAKKGGWQRHEAARMLEEIFGVIRETLSADGRVELRGFGVFATRQRASRAARNINTGESVMIRPHRTAVFRPGRLLKEMVQKGNKIP